MVPTAPPRSARKVVTDLRMTEKVTPGPKMIVMDPRTAEKVNTGLTKAAMSPRIARYPYSTDPDTSIEHCARCLLDPLL